MNIYWIMESLLGVFMEYEFVMSKNADISSEYQRISNLSSPDILNIPADSVKHQAKLQSVLRGCVLCSHRRSVMFWSMFQNGQEIRSNIFKAASTQYQHSGLTSQVGFLPPAKPCQQVVQIIQIAPRVCKCVCERVCMVSRDGLASHPVFPRRAQDPP